MCQIPNRSGKILFIIVKEARPLMPGDCNCFHDKQLTDLYIQMSLFCLGIIEI
jgi:hypothetical protein